MTASTATLTTIRDRLEAALMDGTNLSWDTGTLDEALRRSLAEISFAYGGTVLQLSGLDSALLTTLQKEDESVLITGGEFYATFSRAVDRLETPNMNQDVPDRFLTWADDASRRFQAQLGKIKLRRMQQTGNAPHAAMEWDESTPVW